jgi:hypothetical protein
MPFAVHLLALLLLVAPTAGAARPVEGVEVAESASAGAVPLVLNGAGLRRQLFVRVYLAALYLPARSGDAAAVLAADAPWRIDLTFQRDVDHHRVLAAFTEAFERNSPGQLQALRAGLETFHAVLTDLGSGQVLSLHYLPGAGTTLTAPGGAQATVPGRAFGEAILRTWLGEHPSDPGLARALLGGG